MIAVFLTNVPLREEHSVRDNMARQDLKNSPITQFNCGRNRRLRACMACSRSSSGFSLKRPRQQKGVTGENLLVMLERRLDNSVFRIGFASSRNQARQLVRHNHILVNGRKVNIPSFLVSVGDVITLKEKSRANTLDQ